MKTRIATRTLINKSIDIECKYDNDNKSNNITKSI